MMALMVSVNAQRANLSNFQRRVQFAVAKASPACVYLNSYDPKTKTLMGNRFSGVVINAEGLILTVAHASFPGMSYKVTFPDGRVCIAKGLGRISTIDASVLQIEQRGHWPFAEMGWSSLLTVNQPCVSIAYPASFDTNRLVVRFGYVAEVSSTLKANRIRTTCLMEPGDSGGPTFDLSGRVIGLHSSAGSSVDENFEVPVDLYKKYWNALQQTEDYDGLPIGEEIIPDSVHAKELGFHDISEIRPRLAALTSTVKNKVIRILNQPSEDKEQGINGTLIDMNGLFPPAQIAGKSYLISKNSMIGKNPGVDIGQGNVKPAKIIARDEDKDLILLELPFNLKGGITGRNMMTDTLTKKDLGNFLISPQPNETAILGIIGTTSFNLPMIYRAGYSGASTVMKNGQIVINLVQNNTAASAAKLRPGDEVLYINGVVIDNPDRYIQELRKNKPGDIVTMVRKNNGITDTVNLKLGAYPLIKSDHPAEKFAGGKSEIRDGFKHIFIQDGTIVPIQCGGPVFDIRHHFMGINIARYSRTCTEVLTPQEILEFLRTCVKSVQPI